VDHISIPSGDIRDRSFEVVRSRRHVVEMLHVFGPQLFWGEGPQNFGTNYKTEEASDHVAKFRGDRPTEVGDLTLKIKKSNISSKTYDRRAAE